jgi:predicted amidohydrolase YtcJ
MATRIARIGVLLIALALGPGCDTQPATDTAEVRTSMTLPSTTTTAASEPSTPRPDVIFHGGTVVTMDESTSGDAVAVSGDVITAVGTTNEILTLAGPNTQVIDLDGRALYPGFINGHAHWYAYSGAWVGLVGVFEINEAILERGWTSMTEMHVDPDTLEKLAEAGTRDEIRPRLALYLSANFPGLEKSLLGDWYRDHEPRATYGDRVELVGVKFFIDNGWGSFVHWTADELTSAAGDTHGRGWNVAAHTISHEAHDLVLDAYEAAISADGAGAGLRIEHLLQLRDDQIDRMKRLGIVASMQIGWPVLDFTHEEGLQAMVEGDDPGWYARWQDILAAGIPAIGSTDGPGGEGDVLEPTTASPMGLIHDAVVRGADVIDDPPPWLAEQALTIEQAVRLLTIDAARATGDDDRKGSITPGKWADLVILSADPLAYADDPARILDIEVAMTMIGGRVEFCGDPAVCPDT